MANVMFKQGSYRALQAVNGKATEGTFYVTTDEGGLYLGMADKSLKKIAGSILYFADLDEFNRKVEPPYSTDALYFIAASNALVRYDATAQKWVILNETPESLNDALDEIKKDITKNATAITALKDSLSPSPLPHALTIKIGDTTVTYDRSSAQTVTIDDGTEVSY